MIKQFLLATTIALVSISAAAFDTSKVEKTIELKDGSTVYFFKDGKMAMEDKHGRVAYMKPGIVMETKDGKKIIMIGNEVSRLEPIIRGDHRN